MLAQINLQAGEQVVDKNAKDPKKVAAGKARANSLSPSDRAAIARRAALTRHRSDMPKAIAEGVMRIGDLVLPCAVLDDADNTRILSQNGFLKAIGRHPYASGGSGSAIDDSAPFLRPKNLKPFVSEELERSSSPIIYLPKNPTAGAGGLGYGYKGSLLPGVCWVYHDAHVAGALLKSQQHIGVAATAFLKALTNKAIEDLIDEATGFGDVKKYKAIIKLLEKEVSREKLTYAKMFDTEFYRMLFRLNGWAFDPETSARPSVLGHWMNNFYDRMTPGIRQVLHGKVKRNAQGRPTEKLTQYLTDKEGKSRLRELTEGIQAIGRLSHDKHDFWAKMDIAYPKFESVNLLPFDGGLPRLAKPTRPDSSAFEPPPEQSPPDASSKG